MRRNVSRLISLLMCLSFAGCGHSRQGAYYSPKASSSTAPSAINDSFIPGVVSPPVGSPVDTGYGDIAFDVRASSEQIAAGTAYVLKYMKHWFPYAQHGLHVQVVFDGDLIVNGTPNRGVRDAETGNVII